MIRYYKLFDLLNRRNMSISDLRNIISSATVAKLRKGEYISGEVIEKICVYLECQPGDIMEVVEVVEIIDEKSSIITKKKTSDVLPSEFIIQDTIIEQYTNNSPTSSDEENKTTRCIIDTDIL